MNDNELATRIAEISSLSYKNALAALQAGGRVRELALSILETEKQFEEDRRHLAEAKQKLSALTPA